MNDELYTLESAADEDAGIWLSIGDLMSGLLLFFVLLFVTVLLQLQEAQEDRVERRRILIGTLIEELQGNAIEVEVNKETGDVSVKEGVLFEERRWELTPTGQDFLEHFVPVYSDVIFSREEFENEITRVIIEGHASSSGTHEENLRLSLLRSNAVASYVLSDEVRFDSKAGLARKLLAAGRGELDADPIENRPEDRKVVFRFQFKGEEFIELYRGGGSIQDYAQ
jgi:outer membrane protein OmpA-like peptidoglycan-associated protein